MPPDIQAKLFDAQIECVRFCDQAYNSPLADPLRVILRHTEAFFSTRYGGKDITPAGYLWTAAPELQRLAKTPIKLPYLDTNTQEELIANSKNLNNAFCMQKALEWVASNVDSTSTITTETLRTIHHIVSTGEIESGTLGKYRAVEKLHHGLETASPEAIPECMFALSSFMSNGYFDASTQTLLALHYYHRIHPFDQEIDGSGTPIIHSIMLRRGVCTHSYILPTTWRAALKPDDLYLVGTLPLLPSETSEHALKEAHVTRVAFMVENLNAAIHLSRAILHKLEQVETQWRIAAGRVSRGSTVDKLLVHLLGSPAATVSSASKAINKSLSATSAALEKLTQDDILTRIPLNNKEHVYIADSACQIMVNFLEHINL